ncbi:MAG: biopolymer transporter ExbD [Saprospiraceae bacterium]|nr:biopolymer transporter ExbD [Saprospiraceae bacterium]
MGLKKRNKVSAEFSMSSLTDIIFLLLIFFMLTSNFVQIEPFELPQSDSKTVASTSVVVSITSDGVHKLNNQEVSPRAMEKILRQEVRTTDNRENVTVTIVSEVGTPFALIRNVMDIAARLKVKAIIATQPKS